MPVKLITEVICDGDTPTVYTTNWYESKQRLPYTAVAKIVNFMP